MSSVTTGAPSGAPSPWILDGKRDLLLFIGSPVIILPLLLLALVKWAPAEVYLLVSAFGALGHHLPGMMRAYGDRALFERFKLRFIVAPIFLVAICLYFAFTQPMTTTIVAYSWAVYHGAMQSHGFLRIYDSKRKSVHPLTARLDQLMLFSWFAVGIFLSPTRVPYLLEGFYLAGAPIIPTSVIDALRIAVVVVAAGVTVAFTANAIVRTRQGNPPNPVKLLSLACTITLWWVANVAIENLLVGVVLFELFHDVQYLTIVWLFNQGRATKDPSSGTFTRFVFGQGMSRVPLYLGLIAAYGSLVLLRERLPSGSTQQILAAVLTASAFLHFYYDGFIWKLRDKQTSAALGLEGARADKAVAPAWATHAGKWSLFVVPLALLAWGHHRTPRTHEEVVLAIAESAPGAAQVQWNLGQSLHQRGDLDGAVKAYRRVLEREKFDRQLVRDASANLAMALTAQAEALLVAGRASEAAPLLSEAGRRDPSLAKRVADSAAGAYQRGDLVRAARQLEMAIALDASFSRAHQWLAQVEAARGHADAARAHAGRALQLAPDDPETVAVAAKLGAAQGASGAPVMLP